MFEYALGFEFIFNDQDLFGLENLYFFKEDWTPVSNIISFSLQERMNFISNFPTSSSNYNWRESMSRNGRSVPSHVGERSPVIDNFSIGIRTKTLFNDIATFDPNFIAEGVVNAPKASIYRTALKLEKYDRSYPLYFESYLYSEGFISIDGLFFPSEDKVHQILDSIESMVYKKIHK
jgi:hypothetical protein